jgi:starch synthase
MAVPGQDRPLRVLFAAAEAVPFAKVGGLADVAGALPKSIAALGHDVRLVLPAYRGLGGPVVASFSVALGPLPEQVYVRYLARRAGVDVYTLGSDRWFDRDEPYGYQDRDVLPFVLFSKAVAEYAAQPGWRPDVVHGHDWHCGLVAQEVREGAHRAALDGVGTVFTIHNIAYQGPVGAVTDELIGLTSAGSLMERGIAYADVVNTVSPGYLREILDPAHGAGLDSLLRSRAGDLRGILNGVDYEEFDPRCDPWIAARYDGSFATGKHVNKVALQRASGLEPAPYRPLVGMVARLVPQKGVGLVCSALEEITARGAQVVVMGEGEPRYHQKLRAGASRHAGSVAHHATAGEALARQMYAGCDFFLAPSAFEPCGLTPLIALHYGCIPVVRRTGGMADTISDYATHPASGLGFVFDRRRVAALVSAVDRGLDVYRRTAEWHGLVQRAMAADFSWERPAGEYLALYDEAVRKRRTRRPAGVGRQPRRPARPTPVPLALVHHANQYLATDGYAEREGLTSVLAAYAALLRLHATYRVPAGLHLSGTLVEAAAWHHPWFLDLVRDLCSSGLLWLLGGTYAENVMTCFGPDVNRRGLDELFRLYERHLGCPPQALQACWVPERVWDTDRLAGLLTDPDLANGGYRYVLLDDRLLYPADGTYDGSDRERFDQADPAEVPPADALRPYRIAGGDGLQVVPMSTRLRYWVPPRARSHWRSLWRTAELTTAPGDDTVLVYADDMEKTAGAGPWDAGALRRYEAFLQWLVAQPNVMPVGLPGWLERRRRPAEARALEPGTFVELARDWKAGEDYRGWSQDAAWSPYRAHLALAHHAVVEAEGDGADGRLLALAWKHLLASGYETAWHDKDHPACPPAPWSRALASHARACLVLVAAARWFAAGRRPPEVEVLDVDADGEDELVLRGEHLFAVLTPRHGGRLVYLVHRAAVGAALVVGNPTDDWNWQESLNRYMDVPANHPGALADVGSVHDRYDVTSTWQTAAGAGAELVDVDEAGPLRGTRKRVLLAADATALVAAYDLSTARELVVEACLSPDYLTLLREGRQRLRRYDGDCWRGLSNGPVAVWLARDGDTATTWLEPAREVGHGVVLGVRAREPAFRLLVGAGATDVATCARLLAQARELLHRPDPATLAQAVGEAT